ncbi:MAG TPA: alpha-L-rhamnosidase C-terminal domain-containing protein [Balneolales bacterium]|nr:alpha-L-rhamnosidase C-terminal domain-containing protein [Balneolales bacterium]
MKTKIRISRFFPVLGGLLIFLLLSTTMTEAKISQKETGINPRLFHNTWPAYWIAPPHSSLSKFGVYHYRRDFNLMNKPNAFVIHVSADNRYKLYVNGHYVSNGPSKGDLAHWRFETVNIAPYLKSGHNVIAATVWNFGKYRPDAIQSYKTAFLLQADDSANSVVNSNKKWKVTKDQAYQVEPINRRKLHAYFAVGPGLKIDGSKYQWGWKKLDFNDASWLKPIQLRHGISRSGNQAGVYNGWQLVPRQLPKMENKKSRMKAIARQSGGVTISSKFLEGQSVTIPAHQHVTLLINQGYETTAFPVLNVSGGKGSKIQFTYAEALFNKKGKKGNRNNIEGKHLIGYGDTFIADGGQNRVFSTLWWRTYRYIKMDIQTANQPLQLNDYYGIFTAFPFKQVATFQSNDSKLHQIWNVGWRTVRLCSHETYMDCPYYEEMQYDGDTRIEGLVSTYVSGNPGLLRKAIDLFNDSRVSDGLTQARYPAYNQQIIPPFSLFWVAMVHDYWMYTGDSTYVSHLTTPIHGVMDWFHKHIDQHDMLGPLPRWEFVDWSFVHRGVPPGAISGNSSIITLQYVYALQMAAQMSEKMGYPDVADRYRKTAKRLKKGVYHWCWDANKGLLADTPQKKEFSQHANVMAVLDGMFTPAKSKRVMKRVLADKSLIQTTYYYHFYLFQALKKAGLGNELIGTLKPWDHMLHLGLSTFAETPEPTRSDCHGWSSSPVYEMMTTIAGIQPAQPGFQKVSIQPHLGSLKWINTTVPTPQGEIELKLHRNGNQLTGKVVLPGNESGTFTWHKHVVHLQAGSRNIRLSM